MGKSWGVKGTFALSEIISPKIFISYYGKNSTVIVEKSRRYNLSQVVKVNTISSKTYCHYHIIPAMMYWERSIASDHSSPKCIYSIQSWENIKQTQINRHPTKYQPVLFESGKVLKDRDWGTVIDWRRLGNMTTKCKVGSPTESWSRKKMLVEKQMAFE